MAPKRPSPIEEPPSASETEEEEEEQLDGSEEEDEEEEEEVEPPKPIQSSLKSLKPKPNPTPISLPKPQPSSSDDDDSDGSDDDETSNLNPNPNSSSKPKPPQGEDSDSEEETSDSDSDNEPVKHMIAQRSADAKPISSKPMPAATKSNKPPPAPAATPVPSKPAPKRPLDDDDDGRNKDKKGSKKKKVSEIDDERDHSASKGSDKKAGGENKKLPFQRVWSDENEIEVLNGLIDFKKNGYNVLTNLGAFYDFIKDSLHLDVNKNQLTNKIQRLKQKYQNNANRAKPGEDPVISKPHELKSYRLSKEIWGEDNGKEGVLDVNHVGSESSKPDVKKKKTPVSIASPRQKISEASPKQKNSILSDGKPTKVEGKEDTGSGLEYHYLNQSLKFRNDLTMPMPPQDLGEIIAKKGWDSAKSFNATSLNKRWKEVMIAETEAYLARLDLVREQTKLMLDELVSADS